MPDGLFISKKPCIGKPGDRFLDSWEKKLENTGVTDCIFLSCHVRVSEWIHTQPFGQFGQMVECSLKNYVVLGSSPVAVTTQE